MSLWKELKKKKFNQWISKYCRLPEKNLSKSLNTIVELNAIMISRVKQILGLIFLSAAICIQISPTADRHLSIIVAAV
jgi:hypothetical protein